MMRAFHACVLFEPLLCGSLLGIAGRTHTGCEDLIRAMTNDARYSHGLAAAVRGNAEVVVTENLRVFPKAVVEPYDIVVLDQDEYLLGLYFLASGAVECLAGCDE